MGEMLELFTLSDHDLDGIGYSSLINNHQGPHEMLNTTLSIQALPDTPFPSRGACGRG